MITCPVHNVAQQIVHLRQKEKVLEHIVNKTQSINKLIKINHQYVHLDSSISRLIYKQNYCDDIALGFKK
jgi:division protein CdvB (Snf7/Vps24/ESCRT-III family)